ncbi:MAG TPA: amidohydrolase family protein [Pyrinomonadaceae bacterium]|nr:amidohydrolase family protein [Pyrinomonadaceae bacterium]
MPTLYCANWILPVTSAAIRDGAITVEGQTIVSVGSREALLRQFPEATIRELGDSAIIPGLINAHSHLELTAMRGFLEAEDLDFFAWLKKLTVARLERLTPDDLNVSAAWGACEAARSGVTFVADASDSARQSLAAVRDVGLRGIVFQESFGPDRRLASENFEKLKEKIAALRAEETAEVKCGVSPHAPYTVSASQLEMISRFSLDEKLPLMMHAAETAMEVSFITNGSGPFAEGLKSRGIEWQALEVSPIQYLNDCGVLHTHPLLAHCIQVDDADIAMLRETDTRVAHCPKSNAKLGHGIAPFASMLEQGIAVGLGSDSVASNNNCDLIEEARFALLLARANGGSTMGADEVLKAATVNAARAVGLPDQIGELRAGLQADFAVVSLSGTHQLPIYDPLGALIFASSGRDVTMTVVAGKEIYRDGRITTVDEERLRARITEIAEKLKN